MLFELAFFAVAFIVSVFAVVLVARQNKKRGMTGRDVNKVDKRELPEGVGIALIVPMWLAIVMFNLLVAENTGFVAFGLTVSVLSIVGFLDDRKQKFKVRTISWQSRAVIVGLVCMMFAMFYAPSPTVLWLLPFAAFVAALASFENTFAGLNGWEVGSGLIIAMFVTSLLNPAGAMPIGIALVASILGLLIFNLYPARVFPGDSGTLFIGGSIACIVILNQDIFLMLLTTLFFLPHAIDFFALKFLTNRQDMSQSKRLPYALRQDGKLSIPKQPGQKPRYDFAKLLLRVFGPMPEWVVVGLIWAVVIANCAFWTLLFKATGLI
jgi:UDP-N-acetylglucosamine--dolichyl-phosphate N-acetylglucosaminephosphotransferase